MYIVRTIQCSEGSNAPIKLYLCSCIVTDIDECDDTDLNECDETDLCSNIPGDFTCDCSPGFNLNANMRSCDGK